jgi:hypothetical protein
VHDAEFADMDAQQWLQLITTLRFLHSQAASRLRRHHRCDCEFCDPRSEVEFDYAQPFPEEFE